MEDYNSFCWYDLQDIFRCIPKVYLAGMPKCGTTELYSKLVAHPDIYQPPCSKLVAHPDLYQPLCGKENHFWTRSRVGRPILRRLRKLPIRKAMFEDFTLRMGSGELEGKKEKVLIDGTPSLLWDTLDWETRYPGYTNPPYNNAQLIHAVAPDSKIVVIVRDPVERLYSDYLYFNNDRKHEIRTPQSFDIATKTELDRMSACLVSLN